MISKIIHISIVCMLSASCFATAQVKDHLVYDGETTDLVVCGGQYHGMQRDFFLERYFGEEHPKPTETFQSGSTACYRGYIATWEFKKNKLYLQNLETESWPDEPGEIIPLTKVFPNATNQVFAHWVTAQIRIPRNRELPFRHDGSGSDHELDLYVNITNGVFESQHEVENIGKIAMLSKEHIKWVLSANKPVSDGKSYLWDDAREVATDIFYKKKTKYNHTVRTRGFIRDIENKEGWLFVPHTRLTPYVSFLLHDLPNDFYISNGVPVEIKAKFIPDEHYHEDLKVESIRLLQPGEAIHHPRFRLPMHQIGL